MSQSKDKRNQSSSAGLVERALIGPMQYLTDRILAGKGPARSSTRESVHLGHSPQLYNKRQIDEIILPLSTMLKHGYLIGSTGSGKTFLLLAMILELARKGYGFCVLDIEGDLSQMILEHLASGIKSEKEFERLKNYLVWFEAFNPVYAPGFDVTPSKDLPSAYSGSSETFGIIKNVWSDVSWGARMQELLRNMLFTLSLGGLTLGDSQRLLTDDQFRANVVSGIADVDLSEYWNSRFDILSDHEKPVRTDPVLNKITVFTADPYIRHIVSQKKTSIDFRSIMDQGKGIIINISKGALSENAYLLGSLIVSRIKSAALSRVDQPPETRRPFFLFVDEFQNFMGYNFEEILSEARKYRLSLILAHQNLAQISPRMRESIFGNVATLLFFRLGHNDIKEIAGEFSRSEQSLLKETLSILEVGEVIKREADGTFRKIRVQRLQPPHPDHSVIQAIKQASFDKYYRKRAVIDKERQKPQRSAIILTKNDQAAHVTAKLAAVPKRDEPPPAANDGNISEGEL